MDKPRDKVTKRVGINSYAGAPRHLRWRDADIAAEASLKGIRRFVHLGPRGPHGSTDVSRSAAANPV
jgi:hypothetical protein